MLFLSFEGIDGSGKSTQAQQLRKRLEAEGYETLLVREPGGTALSERVRELLLDPALHIEPVSELLLFSAARAQLVRETIRPALDEGMIVLADRFFDSTTAYQGGGRGLWDREWMTAFHLRVTDGLLPNRTYYFRLPPALAGGRREQRSVDSEADRMERSGEDFFETVAKSYDEIAQRESERVLTVDATRSIDAIAKEVWMDASRLIHRIRGTASVRTR